MAKRTETSPSRSARSSDEAAPFRRMLVAIDESQSAQAAVGLVAEWVDGPGADVRLVQVTEERKHGGDRASSVVDPSALESAHRLMVSGPSLGARNRQVVQGIAQAAEAFGADVIVLGFDRPRLAGHRLAPSLRERIMRATDLPVLVAPSPQSDAKRDHGPAPDLHRGGQRSQRERPYAHV